MQEMILIHSADICHWGIKGQKWGTRRYQNEDGTWTEEGLARRRKTGSSILQKENGKLTTLGRLHYGVSKRKENKYFTNGKLNLEGKEYYKNKYDNSIRKMGESDYKERVTLRKTPKKALISGGIAGLAGLKLADKWNGVSGGGSTAKAILKSAFSKKYRSSPSYPLVKNDIKGNLATALHAGSVAAGVSIFKSVIKAGNKASKYMSETANAVKYQTILEKFGDAKVKNMIDIYNEADAYRDSLKTASNKKKGA